MRSGDGVGAQGDQFKRIVTRFPEFFDDKSTDAAALTEACFHSADLVEGITAFEQSRRPQFGNR